MFYRGLGGSSFRVLTGSNAKVVGGETDSAKQHAMMESATGNMTTGTVAD